jgi:hypothetical protein
MCLTYKEMTYQIESFYMIAIMQVVRKRMVNYATRSVHLVVEAIIGRVLFVRCYRE